MKVNSESEVAQSCLILRTPWTAAYQAPPSMELDTTELIHFHFHALEKEMATHSSVLAWRFPGMGEAGGLLSVGSHRVRHD